jgi:hypothetical protein
MQFIFELYRKQSTQEGGNKSGGGKDDGFHIGLN